jgi:histidinol-phosphate aminotransferase
VVQAIGEELNAGGAPGERLRLYSDPSAMALRHAASEQFHIPIQNILQGNGSDELLAMLFKAFVSEGEFIAYPYPTYVLYETLAQAHGARIQSYDFDRNFTLPEALMGSKAKLVLIANPNSPSGTLCPVETLARLAQSLPHGLLVIDEAYVAYADRHALELSQQLPNVVVLRSFSKSHSLAGMRIGLLFGSAEIVEGLAKVKDSYNLDRLAIAAGAAALEDPAWTEANIAKVRATRSRLCSALDQLGMEVLPSQSNFVFFRLPNAEAARAIYAFLKKQAILVRYFDARLLDDALRVSVGTDEEIDAFLQTLKMAFREA